MKYKLQQKRGELMEKYSRQRDIIFNILKSLTSHPTAEEIYVLAKEQEPNISRGTVYRNLAFLVEKDMIIKISMENGPERYDYIRKEHSHVICANCGKVWDFYYDFKLDSLGSKIKTQLKLEFLVSDIIIKGICDNCKKSKKYEEE